jgi:hypothetical protein
MLLLRHGFARALLAQAAVTTLTARDEHHVDDGRTLATGVAEPPDMILILKFHDSQLSDLVRSKSVRLRF